MSFRLENCGIIPVLAFSSEADFLYFLRFIVNFKVRVQPCLCLDFLDFCGGRIWCIFFGFVSIVVEVVDEGALVDGVRVGTILKSGWLNSFRFSWSNFKIGRVQKINKPHLVLVSLGRTRPLRLGYRRSLLLIVGGVNGVMYNC